MSGTPQYRDAIGRTVLAVVLALITVLSPIAATAFIAQPVAAQTGTALHQANAGGSFTADGETWAPLTDYLVAGGGMTSSHGQPSTIDSSVPSGTPTQIWETERWDPSGGEEMQYEFPVQSGQQVEVRLYFYDGYSGTSSVGDRVFDVSIEGQTVLDNFDIIEKYGDDTGAMESFTVTSDGTIDVDFGHVTENPQINAIEIVSAEPQPDTLGGPGSVDFGTVLVNNSETQTVTVTNLGGTGDPSIDLTGVTVTGTDAGAFSAGAASATSLAPGESADIPVTFSPSDAQAKAATLEISHTGTNTPLTVDLSGEGASALDPGFSKSTLQGFSAGNPTALEFGPDDRLYVSTQGGTLYALEVERTGEDSYQVTDQEQIDAITDIPNHDDNGDYNTGENNRQVTGLTVGGTASQPVLYVSSSDPSIDVGQDDGDTDTNSGAVSRLTLSYSNGDISNIDHDVMVLGLPRSEENHATNGLDLSNDGDTLYVAQGGHTNKGAPGDNFGHTPEYALSGATLTIDLAQINANFQEKNLQNYDPQGSTQSYPDLTFLYAIPTIQNDDGTDGDDLPFGGNDGINQAKLVEGGPVQIYSPGYRNPYDLVVTEDGQVYVSDHGPNTGWGGQPADANGNTVADAANVTNHPNEDGSFSTSDQLIEADAGDYAGHAAPIRANPTGADIYDANGNVIFDINASNSPVPSSMVNPVEADYIPPTSASPDPGAPAGSAHTLEDTSGNKVLFGPTGATDEYTASNFDGAMQGDILQVELGGDIERVELSADGETVTNVETIGNTGGPLGLDAVGDDEKFPGTFWTANHGGNDVTVFEPVDFDGGGGTQCTGADDASLDEDGDGYDNADEIDAGTDPCSSASTPPDFDGDGTSNLNDPDDDNDGAPDTSDPFAVDPDNGTTTSLPVQHDLSELSLFGSNGQGWTGLMTNGQDDYQDLYNTSKMTVGGAAEVLTVEEVPQGDAFSTTNTQQYAFQFGVNPPDEPFVVETTVASFPENPENFQSAGLQIGTGDQSNYVKLVAAADGGNGGVEFAQEEGDSFTHQTSPNVVSDSAVKGNDTTLRLTVDPTTDPTPNDGSNDVAVTAEYEVNGTTTEVGTAAMPASWLDTADGSGLAVGVISTSNGASSTFSATWTDISVEYVSPPATPTADAGADQTVDEGTSVALDATGSTGDGLSYSWTQTAGPDVTLSDTTSATPTFTAPGVDSDTTLTFQVTVSNATGSDTDTVNVTVQDTDQAATGDVVFAVNSGGPEYTASDGTVYAADTNFDGGSTYSVDASTEIGNTTDDTLYQTERYGDPFGYDVPVENGTYQVTLKFAEIFQGVASTDSPDSTGPTDGTNENDRLFNASIEGQQVLTNYDIYADVGPLNATERTYTVEVTDGQLDVDFEATYDNAKVSAIVVENVSQETLTVEEAVASADESGDDTQIEFTEVQTAINWWQTDAEVPGTGGATIDFQKIQEIINLWQTDATVGDGGGNQAPTIDAIADQTVEEGDTAQVSVNASDPDGDSLTLSKTSGPAFVTLTDNGDGTGTLDVAPQSGDAGTYTVTVEADDGQATATESFQLTVTEPGAATGTALVEITPDSGIETSTYGQGSYQVTNTGEKNITSVSFDLSSASYPDMVFDPNGTAGDPTGEGLNIVSDGGTNILTQPGTWEAFSEPHNGVDGDDGYDVMTVEFGDFNPGETATFWADNDPTSIKGATVGSQEAGPVSGLELAGSTVTVTYEDGTTQTTQLMGDGSAGGSTANVTGSEASAPTIGAQGVTLDSGVLDARHSAATVSNASQTITVTGQPGETVTLVRAEGELTLSNVPDADGDGEPGYEIEAYEANDAEDVEYYTATLDANGEASVPVTLTNTTADGDDNAGYNYFTAVHGAPNADAGLASNVVVLKLEESAGDGGTQSGDVVYRVNAGGPTVADSPTDWSADTSSSPSQYLAAGGSTAGGYDASTIDPSVPSGTPSTLFETERYDPPDGSEMQWEFPTESGQTYEVRLYVCDCYSGTSNVGDRVFDVSVEGQTVLDDFDIIETYGDDTGAMESFTVTSDGTIDVDFGHVTENPTVNAIEIVNVSDDGGTTNQAPSLDAIADQTVAEGDTAQVSVNASDPDGDSLTLSKTSGPSFVTLTDNGDGTGTLEIAPQSGDAGTYTVEVTADDGQATATESFQLTVEAPSTGATSADVAVTPGSGIDSSTFSSGSFQVTNTGDQGVSSVTIDLSESLIPDAVFDPAGTAGDAGAKGLVIDSESGDGVGVVSTADGDVFSQPHNGVNDSDGYDAMTVEFTDFDAGETVTFSVDIDPTTIKGASTTGGAGSVSGLELSGSAVTLEYADGSTQATDLFGDGSQGGAQATADAGVPTAPTLGVQGTSLQSTDFPAHGAATVGNASQTLTLSGPAGATVQLLQVEASEPPTDGYDLDAFEADNAQSVSYQSVTLDANGQATVAVTLSETNLNYFVAVVEDGSGETGSASQTMILEVETNTAPSIQTIADQTVVTGETVDVPVTASDQDGDSLTLSKSSGPSFVTLTDTGDGTGSLDIAPQSSDAGTYTVEVTADDGTTTSTESFQLTVDTATSLTSGTALHRVNAGGSTITATDSGPNWTGVTGTSSQYLVSASGGNYDGGDDVTVGSAVPSSTPAVVYDAERYGPMTWEFNVTTGSEVEVRLYLSNQFPDASSDGDRQYNVSVEGQQKLAQYDPVQDVGHANGTVKAFTVTEDGDGNVTITFEEGAIENPQVNAIEIVESEGSA